MLAICVRLCFCLRIVCSQCSEDLMLAMCLILFLPVQSLFIHVSKALLPAMWTFSLQTLSSQTLPQTVRLFNISLHSQAPQQQYTMLSFSSTRRHGHNHKLTFHVHYGITPIAKTPGNHILGCLSCISVTKECMLPNRFTWMFIEELFQFH